jgi:hypothetical protein
MKMDSRVREYDGEGLTLGLDMVSYWRSRVRERGRPARDYGDTGETPVLLWVPLMIFIRSPERLVNDRKLRKGG